MRGWPPTGTRAAAARRRSGTRPSRWHGSDWARHRSTIPISTVPEALAAYPSHGHIDLLPEARGKGIGRRAMAFLEHRLAAAGSPGLICRSTRATAALRFYEAVGFAPLSHQDLPSHSVHMVKRIG